MLRLLNTWTAYILPEDYQNKKARRNVRSVIHNTDKADRPCMLRLSNCCSQPGCWILTVPTGVVVFLR